MAEDSDELLRTTIDLLGRAQHTGDVRFADRIIQLLDDGQAAHRHPEAGVTYWTVLGSARHLRYEVTGDLDALRAAAAAFQVVESGIERTDARWPATASNLGNVLVDVYAATGEETTLVDAVALLRAARTAAPADDANRPALLANLGKALNLLATATDDVGIREEEIAVLREGLASAGSDDDPVLLGNLGNALAQYATRTSSEPVFAESITAYRAAIAATPATHPDLGVFQSNLGNALRNWFEMTGELDRLDQAIAAHRAAVAKGSDADAGRRLSNLATALVRRHEVAPDPAGLTEAIEALRVAVARSAPGQPARTVGLVNLGSALGTRFDLSGAEPDLIEAIAILRTAVSSAPERHPVRATAESALGEALTRRFELTGDAADLDTAVETLRSAVVTTDAGDLAFGLRLSNLARALLRRFERVRHRASLDEAIETAHRAVRATTAESPALSTRLANLGSAMTARYVHIGDDDDLETAVAVLHQAATAGRTSRPAESSALGNALLRAHLVSGDATLLAEATTALRAAVAAAADGDPLRAVYRSNLANALRRTYELGGADADEAAELLRLAIRDTNPTDPNRAAYQFNLGAVHRARFRRDGDSAAARDAASAFLAAAAVRSAPTFVRATAAFNSGRIAADAALAEPAAAGFAEAVVLLDRLAWPGLPRDDQEELLRRFSGVAADAAAWALECGEPERAVELVERGRGVLLAQAIDARSPYSRLREADPVLAERLAGLRSGLDRFDATHLGADDLLEAGPASRSSAERRMALAAEHDSVIAEIAARGLSGLLAPPSFESLRRGATRGPVVLLNVSRYRCDALVLTAEGVTPVPLRVTADEVARRTIAFVDAVDPTTMGDGSDEVVNDVLHWLFDDIADPVLRHAGFVDVAQPDVAPRLWWCPTGVLSFLPLHAACPRPEHASPDRSAVLDRVVSSYTPTIRALLHAQRRPDASRPRALVVSVTEAPDHASLPAAERETAAVRRWLPGARTLDGPAATADAVLDALAELDWLHLACHGRQDPTAPSDGHLTLSDGRLTVRRIAGGRDVAGQLAVLTACETIRGGPELSDEVITMASAVQLAGFRHVVGTLWAGRDSVSARFAGLLYRDLAAGGLHADGAARGVHVALVALRERYGVPAAWAPFAHVGP